LTLKFELLYYGLEIDDVVMGDESLDEDSVEIGCLFEETSVIVNQLAILDGSSCIILFFMLSVNNVL
jgi:hypothetical protein